MADQNQSTSQPNKVKKAAPFLPLILGLLLIWGGAVAIRTRTIVGRYDGVYLLGDTAKMTGILGILVGVLMVSFNLFIWQQARKGGSMPQTENAGLVRQKQNSKIVSVLVYTVAIIIVFILLFVLYRLVLDLGLNI